MEDSAQGLHGHECQKVRVYRTQRALVLFPALGSRRDHRCLILVNIRQIRCRWRWKDLLQGLPDNYRDRDPPGWGPVLQVGSEQQPVRDDRHLQECWRCSFIRKPIPEGSPKELQVHGLLAGNIGSQQLLCSTYEDGAGWVRANFWENFPLSQRGVGALHYQAQKGVWPRRPQPDLCRKLWEST